jgi:dTDP-4-amino-4,6-dideoxygalactose transaminase
LRTELEQYLTAQGVGTRIFYPKSLQDFEFLNTKPELFNDCPLTRNLTETVLALPMWPELTDQEVDYVIKAILDAPALNMPTMNQRVQSVSA